MVPPDKVPLDMLEEMAGTAVTDAWVDMRQVLSRDGLDDMHNMIFARLLGALVNVARSMGVSDGQLRGEFWGYFPDDPAD
jgi:hypothetical protein